MLDNPNDKISACYIHYRSENEIKDMFKIALCKGSAMVKNLMSQNSLDIMEISAMESELVQWKKTVSIIASREELHKEKVKLYIYIYIYIFS